MINFITHRLLADRVTPSLLLHDITLFATLPQFTLDYLSILNPPQHLP